MTEPKQRGQRISILITYCVLKSVRVKANVKVYPRSKPTTTTAKTTLPYCGFPCQTFKVTGNDVGAQKSGTGSLRSQLSACEPSPLRSEIYVEWAKTWAKGTDFDLNCVVGTLSMLYDLCIRTQSAVLKSTSLPFAWTSGGCRCASPERDARFGSARIQSFRKERILHSCVNRKGDRLPQTGGRGKGLKYSNPSVCVID